MQRTLDVAPRHEAASELDLGAVMSVLKQRRRAILVPTVIAFFLVSVFVNVVTPRYTAESQVLLENQETFFTRPDRSSTPVEQASLVDPEAVGSQIQLITSRDLARRAIKDLQLQGKPEFDPLARGLNPLNRVLVLLGLSRNPTEDTVDARVLQTFADKLTVFSPPKTRVITIQFQSKDPELAARIANKMAELYIAEQSTAKRISAKAAADALSGQIADLRIKLAKADAEREQYRAVTGLLAGSNNMTISGQQLADINTDLSRARTTQADAQAKASLLRDLIRAGKTADVTEVVNNDLVRRVSEQRVTAQAQLAQESRTLLAGHPRIKELTAQVADLDAALKAAAKQAAATLENEAKISGQRVANLEAVLGQQKKVASASNGDEVRLRSLDRVAQSYKEQLDSSSTKYQEALSRETSTATPADARIIARAVEPQEASFPKKLPFIIFGTVATLVFAIGFSIARQLLSGAAEPETDLMIVRREPSAPPVVEREGAPPNVVPPSKATRRAEATPADVVAVDAVDPATASPPGSSLAFRLPVRGVRPSAPRPAGDARPSGWDLNAVVDRLKAFGKSAAESRAVSPTSDSEPVPASPQGVGWDGGLASRPASAQAYVAPADHREGGRADIDALTTRIVSAHVPGRGLHIVGASLEVSTGSSDDLLALGRALAERGRSIIVDLNASPLALAALAGTQAIAGLAGLSELLSGGASFAEVIHRDHESRLHFVPAGLKEADFRDFDLILDALSETYDFIILLTPAFPRSDIARVMAPYADLVVLTSSRGVDAARLGRLQAELIEAGAREVLLSGRATVAQGGRTPHVA